MSQSNPEDTGRFAPLIAAIRYGAAGLVAVTVVSVIAWTLAAGTHGLWGALVGAAVGGAFILATVITMYATRNVAPTTTGAILLGSWLLKIIVAIVVMIIVGGMHFYDRRALVVTIIAALVVMLAAEATAIARTQTPYVDPSGPGDGEPTKRREADGDRGPGPGEGPGA